MNIYREQKRKMKKYSPFIVLLGVAVLVIILHSSSYTTSQIGFNSSSSNSCLVSFGEYHGHKYKTIGTIGDGKCLVQSKWMQVMQHKVQMDDTTLIDDWLFIDYHDRINVLVEDPKAPKGETKFLVFRQTKYALEGRQSFAIVGGIIEPNEDAASAAAREVNEELGLNCQFDFLGRFRTDVNRGMGWVNSFVAHTCDAKFVLHENTDINVNNEEVGAPDTEKQDVISLTLENVKQHVKDGEFLEVQWSNTVALAMLHSRYNP